MFAMLGSLLASSVANFDSVLPILGELSGRATAQLQDPPLQDPSTLHLALTCIGILAVFFAMKRVRAIIWPVQQQVLLSADLLSEQPATAEADEPSRGAA
jgi:hypothetical protein